MFKIQSSPTKYIDENDDAIDNSPVDNIRLKSSRSRITLICSLVKIALIFLVSFSLCRAFHIADSKNPFTAFKRGSDLLRADGILSAMFTVQVITSFTGYVMCWLACTMNLQRVCFVIPLILASPLALLISLNQVCNFMSLKPCHNHKGEDIETIILGTLLWLSQILSYSFQFFKSQQFLMAGERLLFWLPTYDGICSYNILYFRCMHLFL